MSDFAIIRTTVVERIIIRAIPAPGPKGDKGDAGTPGQGTVALDGGGPNTDFGNAILLDGGAP